LKIFIEEVGVSEESVALDSLNYISIDPSLIGLVIPYMQVMG